MSQKEFLIVEEPCVQALVDLGYRYLPPQTTKQRARVPQAAILDTNNDYARDGQNRVLLRDEVISAVKRINNVGDDVAHAIYVDLLRQSNNEKWTHWLRGSYSRTVPGESTKQTIHLIDFLEPANNSFVVTNQLYVDAEQSGIPDIVIYVNGIPLVVIEAKSPYGHKDKTGQAFEQIKGYEQDIPRLFHPNAFNIITDGFNVLYGATGSPSAFWNDWVDPWPKTSQEFTSNLEKGLWCLLEPSRLLDLVAHFIVFEREDEKVIKKICRYQQFRAVNKMIERVVDGSHKKGLIWHTQGSGKSLTMVFAALKLKTHLTDASPALANPNILVLTDRKDLDRQISRTFKACGLPNPKQMRGIHDLQKCLHSGIQGQTLLSTIFKFEGSTKKVANADQWILLIDECHRTQEQGLGTFLNTTMEGACKFGFTGTPVKTRDLDTYNNFGVAGEGYLDKYGIDDAVADGATIPIRYTSRKAEWHIDPAKLDVMFDNWFGNEPEAVRTAIKQRGVTVAELAKHRGRIELIAYDIWEHFKSHCRPDGFKAQVVGIDREACVFYKQALDKAIAEDLISNGMQDAEARKMAASKSHCVLSSNTSDRDPSEDPHIQELRKLLVAFTPDEAQERQIIADFKRKGGQPEILIVCNKLLTGFDAPIESTMYLDSPLRDHNLLQAIARTNRVAGDKKRFGLVVDYIGVTKKLDEALASYRTEDVRNAMVDLDEERRLLAAAHREVMSMVKVIKRDTGFIRKEYDALIAQLGGEDGWLAFKPKARAFIQAYESLSPDPSVLPYMADLKWIAGFMPLAILTFEKRSQIDIAQYSPKIREMLRKHLEVTGISTICDLKKLTDPSFHADFTTAGKSEDDLKTAAIRKTAELKKILVDKNLENPLRYQKFSERVQDVLDRFESLQLTAAGLLAQYQAITKDLEEEDRAHVASGLSKGAYGVLTILESFAVGAISEGDMRRSLALDIDALYTSPQSAPAGWHLKPELCKTLRQAVRGKAAAMGFTDLMAIADRVDDFARKHYIRVS